MVLKSLRAVAGGRCRSYVDPQLGVTIDNGNHLVLSGNHAIMAYLDRIGARERLAGPDEAVSKGLENGLEESRVASEQPVRRAAAAEATSKRRPSRTRNWGLSANITQPIERHFLAVIKRGRG